MPLNDDKSLDKEKFMIPEPKLMNKETLPKNTVDYFIETYGQQFKSNGEAYENDLDFITIEANAFEKSNIIECIKKYGFSPIGFLLNLRAYMAKGEGFGLCTSTPNRDFEKALVLISFDMDIEIKTLKELYTQLIEFDLLVQIHDSKGNTYETTFQQIFNYETLCWTRARNRFYQKKFRATNETTDSSEPSNQDNEEDADIDFGETKKTKDNTEAADEYF